MKYTRHSTGEDQLFDLQADPDETVQRTLTAEDVGNQDISWPSDNSPNARWSIYTRGNVGEVYPDVVLPLEWAIGGPTAEAAWRDGAEHIGFLTKSDYGDGDMVVIGVFGGYAYFNASLMRLLGVRTPTLAVDVIDTQFLGEADVPPYVPRKGDRNLVATARMIRTAIKTLTAKKAPLLDEMRRTAQQMRDAAPPIDSPDDVLWDYARNQFTKPYRFLLSSHVINTMQATIASGALTDLCEKKLGDPNLAVALTAGIGNVVSAEPAREMWRLANQTDASVFDAEFAAFIGRHGHRGPNEFSLMGRDWEAFPELAHAAINNMRGVDTNRSPEAQERRVALAQREALEHAHAKLGRRSKRLDKAIANTALWSRAREESKSEVIRGTQPVRHTYLELVRRAAERGGVLDREGPLLLDEAEFLSYLADPKPLVPLIEERRHDLEVLRGLEPPFAFDATSVPGPRTANAPGTSTWNRRRTEGASAKSGDVLHGAAGAPGVARGRARVLTDPSDPTALEPGDVLIAPLTDPSWTPLFIPAAAVIVEVGAAMSHSMIVSRELGIPCVVGVADATLTIPDGAEVEVDGQAGTVTLL
ncbi:MAG: phosphohistidine swiveling domain-containing protein [Candidatus Poriferisodalaceae bacterium]|jgi:phosphohistidine swiveling domain-containing protein